MTKEERPLLSQSPTLIDRVKGTAVRRHAQHDRGWPGLWQIGPAVALGIVALPLTLAGCVPSTPPAAPPSRPLAVPTAETRACHADLTRMGVRFTPLPDQVLGEGCALVGAVRLDDVGVPTTGLGAVRCGEARAFAGWVRNGAVPAAYQLLGSELARVDTFGSYACRNVIGSARGGDRRSGHALANAIDVGGFLLKDGRRVTVLGNWTSPDPATRRFFQTIHASACHRFGTVLSPDYNAAHYNHLHLEDDRAGLCR